MKKTVFQIVVLALFLIMGCSKDDLITTEQDSKLVEENNKYFVNGERNRVTYINSFLDVTPNTESNLLVNSDGFKILENAFLSGSVKGFGPINKEKSYIKFTQIGNKVPCDIRDLNSCYKYIVPTQGIIVLRGGGEINFSMNTLIWNEVQRDGSIYMNVNGSGELSGLNLTGTVEYRGNLYFDEYGILSGRYGSTPVLQIKYRKL